MTKKAIKPPIILRLPIIDEDLIFSDVQYDIPKTTKPLVFVKHSKDSLVDDSYIKPSDEVIVPANKKVPGKMINTGFRYIKDNKWPKKTCTRCWWCAFNFEDTPCAIPYKYSNNTFYVVGCFCSFNCTLAYIIDIIPDKKWEKTSLLHMMYKQTYNSDEQIIATPRKETFKEYGGNIDYNDWKKDKKCKKIIYDITVPPIYNIKPQVVSNDINQSYQKLNRQSIIGIGSNMDDGSGGNLFAKNTTIKNNNSSKDFMSFFS